MCHEGRRLLPLVRSSPVKELLTKNKRAIRLLPLVRPSPAVLNRGDFLEGPPAPRIGRNGAEYTPWKVKNPVDIGIRHAGDSEHQPRVNIEVDKRTPIERELRLQGNRFCKLKVIFWAKSPWDEPLENNTWPKAATRRLSATCSPARR